MPLNDKDGELLTDISEFRRIIGRLMYLTISRPDNTYVANRLSQFMAKPRTPHLHVVNQVIQYLKSTPGQGIFFPTNSSLRLSVMLMQIGRAAWLLENPLLAFVSFLVMPW